jgi:hypothetical protein
VNGQFQATATLALVENPGTQCTGRWLHPTASLDMVATRKIPATADHHVSSQSRYPSLQCHMNASQGSSVSIVPDCRHKKCSVPNKGKGFFALASASRLAVSPTQPPVQWVPKILSPRVKCGWGMDVDHSPPSSAKVQKEEELTSSPPKHLHGIQWGSFIYTVRLMSKKGLCISICGLYA